MSLVTFDSLQTALSAKRFEPVYLVLGPEDYLRRETVRQIRNNVLVPETRAFNLTEFNAKETSAAAVMLAVRTFPMMAAHRIVVVTELDGIREEADRDEYLEYVRSPERKTVLVLTAENLDRRTSFYKVLRDHACTLEFPPLKGAALEKWVIDYVRSRGNRISPKTVKSLADLVGSDLQSLVMEIEKLLLSAGPGTEIAESSLAGLVRSDRQRKVFELTDAMGRRDLPGALKTLGALFDGEERPEFIIGSLARHFRQVLVVRELMGRGRNAKEAAKAAQIPDFIAEQFARQARSVDQSQAERMCRGLAEIDRKLKSVGIDPRLMLERLICSV